MKDYNQVNRRREFKDYADVAIAVAAITLFAIASYIILFYDPIIKSLIESI